MSGRRWAALGLALVGGALALGLVVAWGGLGGGTAREAEAWLEIPASDVAFETLDGGTASLVAHRGELVVLNFWGTWCPPCRREIPELVVLQEALGGRGTVIGVAVESGARDAIRAFAAEYGVNYPIWLSDARKGLAHFDAMGYPFTLLVDSAGVIRKQYLGPQSVEALAADIRSLTGRELVLPGTG